MAQSKEAIRKWMINYVARLVGIPASEVNTSITFAEHGLDSTAAAGLSGDLADWLGIHLEANMMKEHRTIDAVADYVAGLIR